MMGQGVQNTGSMLAILVSAAGRMGPDGDYHLSSSNNCMFTMRIEVFCKRIRLRKRLGNR
jgi:hypothetical protein